MRTKDPLRLAQIVVSFAQNEKSCRVVWCKLELRDSHKTEEPWIRSTFSVWASMQSRDKTDSVVNFSYITFRLAITGPLVI